ncbi:ABC transporter ATP-binding protein [Aeromicrobium sp. CF4.19]|uniref:ABC transporter ATP-binding protein n=1 Tax=Aeromicrobium sp. CF4.19 TaxID=3373082 RepID=UPI003EE66E95
MTPSSDQQRHDLRAQDLSLGYTDTDIVSHLDVQVPPGQITVIVGANACGKSTLLRGLARLLKPRSGAVMLDGEDVGGMRSIDVAKVVGLLPQTPVAPDGITVADLVGRGRYPHQGWFRQWRPEDDEAVQAALEATGTAPLADRRIAELSGGQRQRVWVAMTLAQDTDVLLLDEPTTYLDINHQVELLDLLTDLNRSHGKTIVIVLHDLNLACRYADHIIAMKQGSIACEGAPRDVIDASVVTDVFGLSCEVVPDPVCGLPMIVPRGRHHVQALTPDPEPDPGSDPEPATADA